LRRLLSTDWHHESACMRVSSWVICADSITGIANNRCPYVADAAAISSR
jgi:hypothetical protein